MQYNGKPLIRYAWYDQRYGGALLTQSDLLNRGWKKSTIRKQIGEPDCYGVNPRGGSYVLLYSEVRVRRTKLRAVSA